MIVIGVDVHKHELTAVAVDELGRELSGWSGPLEAALLSWAPVGERLWALEDCRHVSRGLERLLLEAGERLVRVPPRLTAPARRRGRSRGKSDALDALAVARAALREPRLGRPRPQEPRLRELKLLLDHRDDLVAERRRCQQRLRWHLHELDPSLRVPLGALDRALARAPRPAAGPSRADDPGADRPRSASPQLSGQAAERDRPNRALRKRRPACPPRRRRSARGQLGQAAPSPPRPRWQPAAELRSPTGSP
jgi:transposase